MPASARRSAKPSLFKDILVAALILALAAGGLLVYVGSTWTAFLTPISLWIAYAVACLGSVLLVTWGIRKTQRNTIDTGVRSTLPEASPMPWRKRVLLYLGMGLFLFGCTAGVLWLVSVLTLPPREDRQFAVGEVYECTGRKCNACRQRAKMLLRFEWTETDICVDAIQPALREGERVIVRASFHPLMIHIDSVRRAAAAPPASVPASTPTSMP